MQQKSLQNVLMKAKKANVRDYQPYYGSDEETPVTPGDPVEPSMSEIDAMVEYEKQEALMKKNQVLRAILGGFNLNFKMEGIKIKIFTANVIKKQNVQIPSLEIDIGVIAILMGIQQEKVALKVLLKEIKIVEYYRRELMRAFSRQVNGQITNNLMTTMYDEMDYNGGRASNQNNFIQPRQ